MAYTIKNPNGTTLLLLAEGTVDQSTTSLDLVGKNVNSYGESINNNFVKLLSNFANVTTAPPRSPLRGQVWYDTTAKRLKVYDNGFKSIGAVSISDTQPTGLQSGDFWFDQVKNQLYLQVEGAQSLVGPIFPSTLGENGWIMPPNPIKDDGGSAKEVIVFKSYGNVLGLSYYNNENGAPFTMDSTDAEIYFPTITEDQTPTVVSGLTIVGDLHATGKITNNYLSLTVDIDVLVEGGQNDAGDFRPTGAAVQFQNPAIEDILNKVFPPRPTSTTTSTTFMPGLLVGTQARVLCKYSYINEIPQNGYQVRVFHVTGTSPNYSDLGWQALYLNTDPSTNIIA